VQQPLRHRPDDLYVNDLRPARLRGGLRAVQAGLAAAALRRRPCGVFSPVSGSRRRPPALMPGLPAALAVLPALTLRLLPPRPPRLFRPDPLLRTRRPRIAAVHRQSPPSSASRRLSSLSASSWPRSTPIYASLPPPTARRRASSSRCCPRAAPGSSDTSRKPAQPEPKVQPPASTGVSRKAPVNGHDAEAITALGRISMWCMPLRTCATRISLQEVAG
jgi:hypothetical protein